MRELLIERQKLFKESKKMRDLTFKYKWENVNKKKRRTKRKI